MRLILMGCEYAGKKSLAVKISQWMMQTMGLPHVRWHNHFIIPQLDRHLLVEGEDSEPQALTQDKGDEDLFTSEEEEQILSLPPRLLEQFQRHMIWRHLHPSAYRDESDYLLINWYYADSVYAPLYYGYGENGSFADRQRRAREWDAEVLGLAPDTILVLLTAEPGIIRRRMKKMPRKHCIVKDQDIETILHRFQEEFDRSLIKHRIRIDTSHLAEDECFNKFIRQVWPHLSQMDRLRMMT